MKPTKLSIVNLRPEIRAIVHAAAREAFPSVEVREVDAPAVTRVNGAPPDLLVLAEPDDALAAAATQAADGAGLPRWAVVIMGRGNSDLAETVPPEEWNSHVLGRVFRSALLQHQLLCENLRLRGDLKTMARRISHELRTPVGCIHTSSDLLDELSIGKDAQLTNVAEIFRQSSGEISQIIDRVSFVLRASADPAAPAPLDMGAIVAAALRQLEPDIRRVGAVITQPDSWPAVAGVPSWTQAIWWNLLHNALQHGGGAVQVRLGWTAAGDRYRFTVTDRGPGVAAGRETALFVPFDQLHTVRTPGLGLSIVQRLAALQGGDTAYERPADGGASFSFLLPAAG